MLRSKHENWLHAVVDTAVDGVILIDAQGCVLMFNPACEKLFGYAAREVIGENVKMLTPARLPTGLAILNKPYRKAELARRLHEVPRAGNGGGQ
jgi:PAS domain S-box-containing protein